MRLRRELLTPMLVPVLALSGCGDGGEDFQVEMRRPPASVIPFLTGATVSEARPIFPGLEAKRSRPSENEILYTIPGKDGTSSTVLFRLAPGNDGSSTIVHTTVEVPKVTASIDGVMKVVSESRLEALLKTIMERAASEMANGAPSEVSSGKLSALLVAIALATNPDMLKQALNYAKNPELMATVLPEFADSFDASDFSEAPGRDRALPMDRPEYAGDSALHDFSRERAEQEQMVEDAGGPMSDPDA